MPINSPVSPERLAALFSGTAESVAPAGGVTDSVRDYHARYDRCDNCRDLTPCLVTFRGRLDWSPEVAENGPLRRAVEHLRESTGSRTILLCGPCMTRLSVAPIEVPNHDGRLPIDWS